MSSKFPFNQAALSASELLNVIHKHNSLFHSFCLISVVEAKNSEVLTDTQATISCVVKGLTKQLDTVAWQKPGDVDINNGVDGFFIADGTYDPGTNSQTTVLIILAAVNTADKVYTCVITSTEHGETAYKTDVISNVFSKCKGKYNRSIIKKVLLCVEITVLKLRSKFLK